MSNNNLSDLMEEYLQYTQIYAKQIYNQEMWQEQTGCEVDEYFSYIACCENRLYDFNTWFEHTRGLEYPTGEDWDKYRGFKHHLLSFHP